MARTHANSEKVSTIEEEYSEHSHDRVTPPHALRCHRLIDGGFRAPHQIDFWALLLERTTVQAWLCGLAHSAAQGTETKESNFRWRKVPLITSTKPNHVRLYEQTASVKCTCSRPGSRPLLTHPSRSTRLTLLPKDTGPECTLGKPTK